MSDGFPDSLRDTPPTHHETFARTTKSDAPFARRGEHGSLERVPGDFFRALATLYVQRVNRGERPRRPLSVLLRERLNEREIRYHLATLQRQLTGRVKSIPPEVEQAMRDLAVRDLGFRTDADIEGALEVAGLCMTPALRRSAYVAGDRVSSLGALLQRVSSSRSRRGVARCLASRLRRQGLSLGVNALQNILRGKQPLARREVLEEILALLRQHDICSEADAGALWRRQKDDIASYLGDRTFEPAARLVELVRVWRLHHREASSRGLARILGEGLRKRGMNLGLSHVQDALDGRCRRVRHALVVVMEELARQEPAASTCATTSTRSDNESSRTTDLSWVLAQPIEVVAKGWVAGRAGASMNKLAILVTRTAQRMGYAAKRSSVMGVLCGHKKRTRGFVYRATLIVATGQRGARVPQEHVVERVRGGPEAASYGRACAVDGSAPQPRAERKPSPRPPPRASAIRSHPDALSAHFERIGRTTTLDRQTERELARRWQEDGDRRAADLLVESHLRLVVKVARRYQHCGVPLDDLISEGQIGLLVAVRRFELGRERRLMTYATFSIHAYVQRYVARTRSIVKRSRATSTKLHGAANVHPVSGDLSLDVPVRRDGGVLRIDLLADATATAEETMMCSEYDEQVAEEIARVIERLDRVERLVVEDHFMGGLPLADVARRLGISRKFVGRLASRLRGDLVEALQPLRPAP